MKSSAQKRKIANKKPQPMLGVQRGSLIRCPYLPAPCSELAIVVSNDVQNEVSDYLLVVPLERRVSRLHAPFSVDLGRKEGLRELHTARCDWLRSIKIQEITAIERATVSAAVIKEVDSALMIALGIS